MPKNDFVLSTAGSGSAAAPSAASSSSKRQPMCWPHLPHTTICHEYPSNLQRREGGGGGGGFISKAAVRSPQRWRRDRIPGVLSDFGPVRFVAGDVGHADNLEVPAVGVPKVVHRHLQRAPCNVCQIASGVTLRTATVTEVSHIAPDETVISLTSPLHPY